MFLFVNYFVINYATSVLVSFDHIFIARAFIAKNMVLVFSLLKAFNYLLPRQINSVGLLSNFSGPSAPLGQAGSFGRSCTAPTDGEVKEIFAFG